jgi:hypothetical protein
LESGQTLLELGLLDIRSAALILPLQLEFRGFGFGCSDGFGWLTPNCMKQERKLLYTLALCCLSRAREKNIKWRI